MDEPKPFVKFIRTYRKGEVVFEEGSPGHEMYVIASGAVRLTTVKQGRCFDKCADFVFCQQVQHGLALTGGY